MIRRRLALILALMLCAAASAETFVVEGITWSSTPEEVLEIWGPDAHHLDQMDDVVGKLTMIDKEDGQFASLPCSRARIMFWNNVPIMVVCFFKEADLPEVQPLLDAAVALYGEPDAMKNDAENQAEYVAGSDTLAQWELDGTTTITLSQYTGEGMAQEDYPYRYWIAFENVPVSDALNEIMIAWMETQN